MRLSFFLANGALAVGVSCNSIESPISPPVNSCTASPCFAYMQPGTQPGCVSGACLVTAPVAGLVVVIDLPVASSFAPGSTFAVGFDEIFDAVRQHPIEGCDASTCASLPAFVPVQDGYLIRPNAASTDVGFPLGNPTYTTLPAQATFRLLWPPTGGTPGILAESLGLPIEPVVGVSTVLPSNSSFPGPGGGPAVGFQAYLQPGSYQVVLRPSPPFDRVFGPEVQDIASASTAIPRVDNFDVTQETGQGPTIPAFDIARVGGLDGWSAYLQDASGLVVSNVVPLAGTATHAVLATNHVAQGVDALTGTELVIAPPFGDPYPTAVFAPIGNVLPASETYPVLPAPAMISGSISSADDSAPVAADLVFEALAITDSNGNDNSSNFEFVAEVQASPGAPFGLSPGYSIELPQGLYRLSVHPVDTTLQVTTVTLRVLAQNDSSAGNVLVAPLRVVSGTATVADGRPLSAATVEAVPVGCASGTSGSCLPREASATSGVDGSFQLALDPGQYLLRVRPVDGTSLPWTIRPLSVGAEDEPTVLAPVTVPAPIAAGLTLLDPTGAPLARAQVRFFSIASQGPAIEVGRARTDGSGRFEMYLQPPAQ
jgi:hypothetical protein